MLGDKVSKFARALMPVRSGTVVVFVENSVVDVDDGDLSFGQESKVW